MASKDEDENEKLQSETERLNGSVASPKRSLHRTRNGRVRRSVRYRSSASILGMPLICVAMGPDLASGEIRGHAKGILAVGDIATGVFALGGVSCGVVAIGGVAAGLIAVGGVAIGVIAGVGGVASGYFAVGGVAMGVDMIGGARVNVLGRTS